MSRIRFAAMSAALMLMSSPALACNSPGSTGIKGAVVDGTMSVQNGKTCMRRHFTNTNDAVGARNFPTSNIVVKARPSRGSVSVEGNRITYRAPAGVTGSDQFSYRTTTNKGAAYDYRVLVTIY